MFAELVTSGNMVQLKNGVCFILAEAKAEGGLRCKENFEAFSFLKVKFVVLFFFFSNLCRK